MSEEELKSFGHWLRSPWCNSNKNLVTLFEKLKKYYPAFDNRKLTKEKLAGLVLPKSKFSEKRINNLLSEAFLAAKKFMVFQSLNQKEGLRQNLLLQEFRRRNLDDWSFRESEKEILRLETKKTKEWEDYLDLFLLNRQLYLHPRQKVSGDIVLKMGKQIDLLYLLEKASLINDKIFRNRILKHENYDLDRELDLWKSGAEGIDHPALNFYKKRFEFTSENILEKHLELRELFFQNYESLNKLEQRIHLLSLTNDAAYLRKKGQLNMREILAIYKFGFQTNILPVEGNLTTNTFASIITMSNALKDFEFSKSFCDTYSQYLPEEIREDAVNWAVAGREYRMGNLENSLNILLQREPKSFIFKRVSKVLNLQVYFDLYLRDPSYYDYLMDYCGAFEKWVNREKFLSTSIKEPILQFIQRSKELIKFATEISPDEQKLSKFLEGEKGVEARTWLLQKRDDILGLKKI